MTAWPASCASWRRGPHIALIETFAERTAVACLADPRVLNVVVRVEKPGAIPDAAAAACEVAYSR